MVLEFSGKFGSIEVGEFVAFCDGEWSSAYLGVQIFIEQSRIVSKIPHKRSGL